MPRNMPDSHFAVKGHHGPRSFSLTGPLGHTSSMDRLKEIRRQRGLSQQQLGEIAGFDQGYISKIERGEANPSLDTIKALAAALGAEPHMLFTRGTLRRRADALFDALPDDRQALAVEFLEVLSKADR